MPFGLQGAPATFQRLCDCRTRLLCCLFGRPDCVQRDVERSPGSSRTSVLKTQAGRLDSEVGMKECVYLGHVVGKGQVRPEPSKLEAVVAFPVPKTKKDVRD